MVAACSQVNKTELLSLLAGMNRLEAIKLLTVCLHYLTAGLRIESHPVQTTVINVDDHFNRIFGEKIQQKEAEQWHKHNAKPKNR